MDSNEKQIISITDLTEASEQIIALKLRLASLEEQRSKGTKEPKAVQSNFSFDKIIWILFVGTLRIVAQKVVAIIYSKKRS